MTDAPLARALRLLERLIAKRLEMLHAQSLDPTLSRQSARKLRTRADELGKLIGEIRQVRIDA